MVIKHTAFNPFGYAPLFTTSYRLLCKIINTCLLYICHFSSLSNNLTFTITRIWRNFLAALKQRIQIIEHQCFGKISYFFDISGLLSCLLDYFSFLLPNSLNDLSPPASNLYKPWRRFRHQGNFTVKPTHLHELLNIASFADISSSCSPSKPVKRTLLVQSVLTLIIRTTDCSAPQHC